LPPPPTVRYRLERVRELCGHDVSSTEGREKLGLGLKAMRVLGIASPRGPASEPRSGGGQGRPHGGDLAVSALPLRRAARPRSPAPAAARSAAPAKTEPRRPFRRYAPTSLRGGVIGQ